ncbi:hypothetical protein CVIRNUC_003872 [Coccomyxa viridis]|uniref:Extracellular protein n=1 Tax=Coccomyxa viridis TaxID=1274662 RepID=A0AAV1I1T1_9CHLO|nr:hypothetical protein CVIRNUC_003872 [Coccomyxa viridis]
MSRGRASAVLLCLACFGLATAAIPSTLTLNERDTCFGALVSLKACHADLPHSDIQQRCCIPFRALEGLDCFCDADVVSETLTAMQSSVVGGLFACGLDTPFTTIYERQERCTAAAEATELAEALPTWGDASADSALLAEEALDFTPEQWDAIFSWDDEEAASIAEQEVDVYDDWMDADIFEDFDIDFAEDAFTGIAVSGDLPEVLYDESLDADAESTILLDAAQEVELPTLMVPAGDKADSSVSSLYNADFSDVDSMMGLLSSWLGTAIGSGAVAGSSEAAAESREDIGGLSQVLAEILASLQNTFAGTPLDVEISYEGLSEGEDTEIDIEIDPELVPVLEPQFLDEKLQALSQKWSGRALRPAPARIPEGDLQQLLKSLERQPASLANCFNTGICNWLCHHRQSLQYALGMETILLVALFALYARYNRRARGLQMDAADEESLREPLIVSAADYAEKEPLWTLTTKVAIEHQ